MRWQRPNAVGALLNCDERMPNIPILILTGSRTSGAQRFSSHGGLLLNEGLYFYAKNPGAGSCFRLGDDIAKTYMKQARHEQEQAKKRGAPPKEKRE